MAIAVLIGQRRGLGIVLEIGVHHHFVTLLIGIEEVEDVGRRCLEPANVFRATVARDQREARRDALMQPRRVDAAREQLLIPEHRQIVHDRPIFAEGHVVRQARSRQRNGDVGGDATASVDDAVMHVRRVLRIVEEQQFARPIIDLGMRRDPVERHPRRDARLLERFGIEHIALAALIEGRDRLAGMDDDVGARRIFQAAMRAKPWALRCARPVHQPAPQRSPDILLGLKAACAHEAVAVRRATAREIDLVDHPVAIEGMIFAERLVQLILGIAEIDAVEIGGDRTFDHVEIERGHLFVLRRPGVVEIGMVARL